MNKKDIFMAGGAACAMFFGSGNIVLPLIMGQLYPDVWQICYFGFVIGAVFLPLLGLLAITLRGGSPENFFKWLGPIGTFLIQLIILGMLGPFGAVPRCFTVAYGGFKAISTSVPDYIFYFIFSFILFIITCKQDTIMPVISKFLTPLKLMMLIGAVIICLILSEPVAHAYPVTNEMFAFKKSILYGYQTMDLVGAIYYGSLIVSYVIKSSGSLNKKELLFFGLKSAFIAGILLSVLYLGFIYLAIEYHHVIIGETPDILFIKIAESGMGHFTACLVGLTIVVSCLTTAVAVISAWTNFLMSYLSTRWIINYKILLLISLAITFTIAQIGLSGILDMLEPLLAYIYPVIIIITISNIYFDIRSIIKNKL